MFRHADPEQAHQRRAQRRKIHEVAHRLADHPLQARDRKQIHRRDRIARHRMDHLHARETDPARRHDDHRRQQREHRRRMRQRISRALHRGEKPLRPRRTRFGGRRGIHQPKVDRGPRGASTRDFKPSAPRAP